jgi:CheY-like chemotaxis protein
MNESEDSGKGGDMLAGCLEETRTRESMRPPESLTKLLVVGDSEFEHQLIDGLLRGVEGLSVVHASGGAVALRMIDREPPDVVLTDLFMPDMDGLELVKRVHERQPGVPLILMTAFGSEQAAIQALRTGAANYLPKKDLARDLVDMVRQVLDVFTVDRRRRRLLQCVERRESVFEIGNEPELISPLVQLLQEEIDGLGVLDRPARIRIRVALQEALTNALYHGNLEVDSDLRQDDERVFFELAEARRLQEPYKSRRIQIATHLDRHAATFVVRDEGPGFDTSRIDQPIDPEDLLRIGGRGLLLIRTFMDEVTFNPLGNAVTMLKRLTPADGD